MSESDVSEEELNNRILNTLNNEFYFPSDDSSDDSSNSSYNDE